MVEGRRRDADGPPVDTLHPVRDVLVVVRTMTCWNRLVDVLPALQADPIAVHVVIEVGSRFAAGLREYLLSIGTNPLSWRQARSRHFDLVLAAHASSRLAELPGPLVLLPHGAGYSRIVPWSTGDDTAPAGLHRSQLIGTNGSLPSAICLSHVAQQDQLAWSCQEAAHLGVVIGDPTFDRITASRSRRSHYRQVLGAGGRQKLVVLTSTWGPGSAVGINDTLAHRLVAQLPSDEFRVALVLHPNIWFRHSRWTIRQTFRDPMDGGMIVIPPASGWQAALLAADIVVGDHGSVAFYAAALGLPLLLAATGLTELDPRSARSLLNAMADRLDTNGDLTAQLRTAVARHNPADLTAIADLTLGQQGESLSNLQRICYQIMDLDVTRPARVRPLPDPVPERGDDVTAHLVDARVQADTVTLARYPAILAGHRQSMDLFTVVEHTEVDIRQRQSADVLVHKETLTVHDALSWLKRNLDEYPGAGLAAARIRKGCLICRRDGTYLMTHCRRLDPTVAAAAVYGWLVAAGPTDAALTVRLGPMRQIMAIRAVRYPGRSP